MISANEAQEISDKYRECTVPVVQEELGRRLNKKVKDEAAWGNYNLTMTFSTDEYVRWLMDKYGDLVVEKALEGVKEMLEKEGYTVEDLGGDHLITIWWG